MAVTIPTSINKHTKDPDTDPLDLENIGGSTRSLKGARTAPLMISGVEILNPTVGTLQGTSFSLPSPFDGTTNTKILVWAWRYYYGGVVQVDTLNNDGIVARLYSSLGNYLQFRIGGNDTLSGSSQRGFVPFILDPQSTTFNQETGSFDITNVSGYGWAATRSNIRYSNKTTVNFTRAYLFDTIKNGDLPTFIGNSNFDDIIIAVLGTDYTNNIHTFVSKIGSAYTLMCPWQIGDSGSTITSFNDNEATVISPSNNDSIDPRFHLSNQAMRVYLSLGANDTVNLSGMYSWGTAADWDFDSSVGATVNLAGATFSNMGNFTIGSDVSTNGTHFKLADGKKVIDNGAAINNIIVDGSLEINTLKDLTRVTATKLILSQGGAYNFTGCLISEVENKSGAAIIIISDSNIITQTETSGSIALTVTSNNSNELPAGTYLMFNGIDSWEQFSSAEDREINSNSIASGEGTDNLDFTYTEETIFYLKLVFGDEVLFRNITVNTDGPTIVSLGTPTLLNTIQAKMNTDHAEIKETLINGNSRGNKLNHTWEF